MKTKKIFKILLTSNLLLSLPSMSICCINFSDYDFAPPSHLTTSKINNQYITSFNLRSNVEKAATNYLRGTRFTPNTIPNKLLPEYRLKIDETMDELTLAINCSWDNKINHKRLHQAIKKNFSKFYKKLKKIILDTELNYQIDEIINKIINIYSIDTYEYYSKKEHVLNNLRSYMYQDSRNYVRRSEVKKEIKKVFTPHFSTYTDFSWNNVWDDVFVIEENVYPEFEDVYYETYEENTYPEETVYVEEHVYPQETVYVEEYPTYNNYQNPIKIKRHQLDDKILEIAEKFLGKTHEKIPARVISDYSDKIYQIKIQAQQNLDVYSDDIELNKLKDIVHYELQTILNKINYKSEICAICTDEFHHNDRVGTLSCNGGHIFHTDCIYQWFRTENNNNNATSGSCPLCRQQDVIVSTIENTP